MLNYPDEPFVILGVGALTLLFLTSLTDAAGSNGFAARILLDTGVVELVHYNKRSGWHCGRLRDYGHEHSCRRKNDGTSRGQFGAGGRSIEN